MNLDLYTVALLTALVVIVTSVSFIVGMLVRKDDGAGRVWGLAFLSGLLTVIAYLVWASTPSAWWAVAIGNAAFVANAGCMWLGARRFNRRRMLVPSVAVGVAIAATMAGVLAEGPTGGDWAGALLLFSGVMVFAALGAFECLRPEIGRDRTAWGLAFILGLEAAFFAARMIVFLIEGPEGAVFLGWFDTVPTSFLTITLSIVALLVTSVLLSGRARLAGTGDAGSLTLSDDDVLPEVSFVHVLLDMSVRARRRGEMVGVISLRIDDLPAIATAFGSEAAVSVAVAFRAVVRRFAPTSSFVGQDGPTGLLVGIQPDDPADARRIATRIRRGLFDELSGVVGVVIPVVGVGVALSSSVGYEPSALMRASRNAALEAAVDTESSVVMARRG